ncbi:hypothetical protein IWX87_003967 [Polaromonas sp. CG_9.7]|nr:hypothetical protein [Polaromonas sp. CG_9.7]MBG6116174.1 hypothetical protein [Polaromonas sp. CG_9.2]
MPSTGSMRFSFSNGHAMANDGVIKLFFLANLIVIDTAQ